MLVFVKEKEYEALAQENRALLEKIQKLEEYADFAENTLNNQRNIIGSRNNELCDLKALNQHLEDELKTLRATPRKIHNERGAGRKRLATDEQIFRILELHNDGYSLSQIVKELNLPWNKGTIKNIIDRAKVNNQAGG